MEQNKMNIECVWLTSSGGVKLIDRMGSEEDIIRAARMSTSGSFRGWDKDEGLLAYLFVNQHMTPFEMCILHVEVECPIFIARQWMRHRTFSYNELSGRYTELPDVVWIPGAKQWRRQSFKNKQGSEANDKPLPELSEAFETAEHVCRDAYRMALEAGVAREQARVILPVGTMTRFRVCGNLRNWLHFLELRLDPHAQQEIREFAEAILKMIRMLWPRTAALFEQFHMAARWDVLCREIVEQFAVASNQGIPYPQDNPLVMKVMQLLLTGRKAEIFQKDGARYFVLK